MRRRLFCGLLALLAGWALLGGAEAEPAGEGPLTRQELTAFAETVREMALSGVVQNDPSGEDALSEDGITFQYAFGQVYADRPEMKEETVINAFQIMDREVPGPRGIAVDWEVNQVMETIPCANPGMDGTHERALLYLEGTPEAGYLYGLVERDGQRISVMEYGAADPAMENRISLTLLISGDGVDAVRMEGLSARQDAGTLRAFFDELEQLRHELAYSRVPRSLDGSALEMFQESDLDFSALIYQTAEPEIFGGNVEDVLIDNDDGTWLRRVDGDGFSAVFTCDENGRNADLISYTILSPELEGPRCVRLGDLFHEDFQRFRSGEGALDATGTVETLYGTVGKAPYGLAEYGNGDEMILRYVTDTLSGPEVELLLRYENTVLTEIMLHTLSGGD